MHPFRPPRWFAALLTIFCLLFAQLATAAYVCPDLAPARSASAHMAMAGCTNMDMQQPSLCHSHCQDGKQSLDQPDAPQVQPFVAGSVLIVASGAAMQWCAPRAGCVAAQLARSTAPPLSIQHCCFRI